MTAEETDLLIPRCRILPAHSAGSDLALCMAADERSRKGSCHLPTTRRTGPKVFRELVSGTGDLASVRVQILFGGSAVGVPGDLLEYMLAHPGIGHPCQPGMAQIVFVRPSSVKSAYGVTA